jgi:hypothetical protein
LSTSRKFIVGGGLTVGVAALLFISLVVAANAGVDFSFHPPGFHIGGSR